MSLYDQILQTLGASAGDRLFIVDVHGDSADHVVQAYSLEAAAIPARLRRRGNFRHDLCRRRGS